MSNQLFIGIAIFVVGILGMISLLASLFKRSKTKSQHYIPASNHKKNSTPQANTPFQNTNPAFGTLPYERRAYLMTQAELTFFDVLRAATPSDMVVFPQMRLASIINVATRSQRNKTHFYRIQAKCVDFVLCDLQTTAPRLVVELDDSSHDRPDRQARDRFVDEVLSSVGLPILHVRWQRHYNVEEIAASLKQLLILEEDAPVTGWSKPIAAPPQPPISLGRSSAPAFQANEYRGEPFTVTMSYSCGQCQKQVRQGARFCTHCGAILSHG